MSYTVSKQNNNKTYGQAYTQIQETDEENTLTNPLVQGNIKRQRQVIEQQLVTIKQKIKQLEDQQKLIGTESDTHAFRQKIQQLLTQTGQILKTCSQEIKEFGEANVAQNFIKEKREQFTAFQNNQQQLAVKLQRVGQEINEKQIQYSQGSIVSKNSMVASSELVNQNDFMVNGINDGNKGKQQQLAQISKQEIKILAETDLYESQIHQRKQDIDEIASIMQNINSLANDIAIETSQQKEKLVKLDDQMEVADDNAQEALNELNQAKIINKKTGKCTYFLTGTIILSLFVVILVILTRA